MALDNVARRGQSIAMSGNHFDVAIVGGGFAGAPLAVALARSGLSVALIDRRDGVPGQDGRSMAVALGPKRMFDALDIWPDIEPFAAPILDIRVTDGDTASGHLHYDHYDVGSDPLGWIVENHHLLEVLADCAARTAGLTSFAQASLKKIDLEGARARIDLEDGTSLDAELIVAADGRASPTRAQAGIGVKRRDYGQSAIACTVRHEREHGNVAHERFLPAGPFAILPLPGRRSSIVWTDRTDRAQAIDASGEALFMTELRSRFGDFLGALETEGPRTVFPLSMQWAEAATAHRLALIGDALHGMHPVAGQGMNMGLRDVAALAEAIVDARRLGLDAGSAQILARYDRWRRFDNMLMLGVTDGLVRLFSNEIAPLRLGRDFGLGLVNRLAPLKRVFMRHAMGVAGEVPRLFRGEPL